MLRRPRPADFRNVRFRERHYRRDVCVYGDDRFRLGSCRPRCARSRKKLRCEIVLRVVRERILVDRRERYVQFPGSVQRGRDRAERRFSRRGVRVCRIVDYLTVEFHHNRAASPVCVDVSASRTPGWIEDKISCGVVPACRARTARAVRADRFADYYERICGEGRSLPGISRIAFRRLRKGCGGAVSGEDRGIWQDGSYLRIIVI